MRIHKATIFGVANFAKKQSFEFSVDESRRITVLHGENGAGKTSALNALLWCLTGQLSPAWLKRHGGQPDGFINSNLDLENVRPFVEVEFEFEGDLFRATRKALATKLEGEFSLKRLTQGVWDSYASRSSATMTNILPPGIARYFIFDGEGFQHSKVGDRGVISAVKTIFGFDHVEMAINHLELCLNQKTKDFHKVEGSRIKDEKRRIMYEQACNRTEELKKRKSDLFQLREGQQEELEVIRAQIEALNIARVNGLKREEREKEALCGKLKREIVSYQRERLRLVGAFYRPVFGRALFDQGLATIERFREKGVIPGKYSRQLIEDLKDAGVCICGRGIGEHEAAILEGKIRGGFTSEFQQRLNDASACQKDDVNVLDTFRQEHAKVMSGINDGAKSLKEAERRLMELQQELEDLGSFQEDLASYQNKEVRLKAQLSSIDQEITEVDNELEEAGMIRKSFKPSGGRDKQREEVLQRELIVLEEILSFARRVLTDEFKKAHELIEREMNIFLARTNIPYSVRLDSGFNFYFVDAGGQSGYGSTGELKTLEYAFLCSLVRAVREKSVTSEGLLQPGSRIPLVLDAPFSELAETYVRYISDMLLSVADQLTVLMFNKDWKDFEAVCAEWIGHEYVLVKHITESGSGRAEEILEFRGQRVKCVQYDSDVDHTTVERIL